MSNLSVFEEEISGHFYTHSFRLKSLAVPMEDMELLATVLRFCYFGSYLTIVGQYDEVV
jgi:hypothetical protein